MDMLVLVCWQEASIIKQGSNAFAHPVYIKRCALQDFFKIHSAYLFDAI